jgi:hypothetical protein
MRGDWMNGTLAEWIVENCPALAAVLISDLHHCVRTQGAEIKATEDSLIKLRKELDNARLEAKLFGRKRVERRAAP